MEDLSWSELWYLFNKPSLFVWQSFMVVMMMMSLWATEMRLMMPGKGCKHDEDWSSLTSRPLIFLDGPCYRWGVAPVLNPVGSPAGTFVTGTFDISDCSFRKIREISLPDKNLKITSNSSKSAPSPVTLSPSLCHHWLQLSRTLCLSHPLRYFWRTKGGRE